MKVVTYATHSYGTFEEIINNPHGVKVDVLGMDSKWLGFMDKIKGVYQYCQKLSDDEIVVFIDGFDSTIIKSLDGLEKVFNTLNCGVLLSNNPKILGKYINNKIFGTCKNGITANSGLYMGTVYYLKIFLKATLEEEYEDDQTNFNSVCSQFDWVKVDEDNLIFYNKELNDDPNWVPDGVYFKSAPGSPSIQRYVRSIYEYGYFFKLEILVLILILFLWTLFKSS